MVLLCKLQSTSLQSHLGTLITECMHWPVWLLIVAMLQSVQAMHAEITSFWLQLQHRRL